MSKYRMVKVRKSRKVQKSKKRYTRKRYSGGGEIKDAFLKAIKEVKNSSGKPYTDIEKFFQKEAKRYPEHPKKSLEYDGKTYYYYINGARRIKLIVEVGDKEEVVGQFDD
jgi:hypothetical protein